MFYVTWKQPKLCVLKSKMIKLYNIAAHAAK